MLEYNKKYEQIAKRLIEKDPDLYELKDSGVRIAYLSSGNAKKQNRKICFADCRSVMEQYSWICPYDFMITVYEPNVVTFTKKQMEILIKHELLHIGVDNEGNEPSFYVAPHDVEEFYSIITEHGFDWAKEDKCQEEIIQTAERT